MVPQSAERVIVLVYIFVLFLTGIGGRNIHLPIENGAHWFGSTLPVIPGYNDVTPVPELWKPYSRSSCKYLSRVDETFLWYGKRDNWLLHRTCNQIFHQPTRKRE